MFKQLNGWRISRCVCAVWLLVLSQPVWAVTPGIRIGLDFATTTPLGLDFLNFLGTPIHVMNPWPLTDSRNAFVTEGAFAELTEQEIRWGILREVQERFYAVPTPAGMELNVDFQLGEVTGPRSVNVALGAYNFEGTGNKWFGQSDFREAFDKPQGGHMAAIALDEIATLRVDFDTPDKAITAIANVTAHEVGHLYGLRHVCAGPNCTTCGGSCALVQNPYDIMATGPSGLPEEGWIQENIFSDVPGTQDGGLSSRAMLINGTGLRRLGDSDYDDDVDSGDLLMLIGGWTGALDFGAGGAAWSAGDFDHDFDVDSSDLLIFLGGWTGAAAERSELADVLTDQSAALTSWPPAAAEMLREFAAVSEWMGPSQLLSVPEPSAVTVCGLGLSLLGLRFGRTRGHRA